MPWIMGFLYPGKITSFCKIAGVTWFQDYTVLSPEILACRPGISQKYPSNCDGMV